MLAAALTSYNIVYKPRKMSVLSTEESLDDELRTPEDQYRAAGRVEIWRGLCWDFANDGQRCSAKCDHFSLVRPSFITGTVLPVDGGYLAQ